ncbi:MAG: sulfite exporter TauE/SafE family protein [Bacteroidales bacterium]
MGSLFGSIGLFIAAMVAGAVNSVAGGGSLISFPALVAFGQPAILANATNTAALWPGSVASAVAYRRQTSLYRGLLPALLVPSIVGGLLGAFVLVSTPPALFDRVVPFLVLFATVLFAFRRRISQAFAPPSAPGDVPRDGHVTRGGRVWGFSFQLVVATYGGYFGAGIGILMLASLSLMGLRDIHRMNAVKTILGALINVIAFVFFAVKGLVVWPLAALMAAGAILGGYLGARVAMRVDQRWVARFVIAVGVVVSAWLFLD